MPIGNYRKYFDNNLEIEEVANNEDFLLEEETKEKKFLFIEIPSQ